MKASSLSHVRPPRPLLFPVDEREEDRMPEGRRHWILKGFLFRVLRMVVGDGGSVGADQFMYFDASDPTRCCAPDGFVKLDVKAEFESWKTWEHGVPELVIEILSPSDTKERWTLEEKLARFHALGAREVALVNLDAPAGRRIRAWDRLDDDLVERVVTGDATPCLTLDLHWVIAPAEGYPVMLRLACDPAGRELVPSPEERATAETAEQTRRAVVEAARADTEAARADTEAARAAAEAARADAEAARRAEAEARIAELERALRDRKGR